MILALSLSWHYICMSMASEMSKLKMTSLQATLVPFPGHTRNGLHTLSVCNGQHVDLGAINLLLLPTGPITTCKIFYWISIQSSFNLQFDVGAMNPDTKFISWCYCNWLGKIYIAMLSYRIHVLYNCVCGIKKIIRVSCTKIYRRSASASSSISENNSNLRGNTFSQAAC